MDIVMLVMGVDLRGTLDDTAAGRDFAALLPLTVTLTDFHGTEKISDLPRPLCTGGNRPERPRRPATSPTTRPGATSPCSTATSPSPRGLVRLGRLEPGAAEVLAGLEDTTTLTIAATN
jgi:hypothetical protein